MIKVVTDTNTLVSGTFWTGDSFRILNLIDTKRIINILSKDIIKEYKKVLASDEIIEKTENKNLVVSRVVQKVIINSIIVEPKKKYAILKDDPDDDKFVNAAVEGKADYIISNDKHLRKIEEFKGIKIVSPKEFLDIFDIK